MVSTKEKRICLIFEITGKLYGIEAHLVQEIVRLPEILPMEDAPPFVVGVFNLHGRVVPVVDLNLRFGRVSVDHYPLSDAIVVLKWQEVWMGVIVNDVRAVHELIPDAIDGVPVFEAFEVRRYRFVMEVAKVDEEMVMLLNVEHLLHAIPRELSSSCEDDADEQELDILLQRRVFNPQALPEERALLHARAQRLMRAFERQEIDGLLPYAVVELHGECLGIDLIQIQGFAMVRQVTPVPCCPDHIAGSMNLRGEVLILVDLTGILQLPAEFKGDFRKVMVVRVDHMTVGVLVHDVVDLIYRRPDAITRSPVATSSLQKEHLFGATQYEKGMLGILNLEVILKNQVLFVNEVV